MSDEWHVVAEALSTAGVAGVEDLGRFANNTQYFEPSKLDERAAAPVLLGLLPSLQSAKVVETVGRHLQGPWLRTIEGAYEVLREGVRPLGAAGRRNGVGTRRHAVQGSDP